MGGVFTSFNEKIGLGRATLDVTMSAALLLLGWSLGRAIWGPGWVDTRGFLDSILVLLGCGSTLFIVGAYAGSEELCAGLLTLCLGVAAIGAVVLVDTRSLGWRFAAIFAAALYFGTALSWFLRRRLSRRSFVRRMLARLKTRAIVVSPGTELQRAVAAIDMYCRDSVQVAGAVAVNGLPPLDKAVVSETAEEVFAAQTRCNASAIVLSAAGDPGHWNLALELKCLGCRNVWDLEGFLERHSGKVSVAGLYEARAAFGRYPHANRVSRIAKRLEDVALALALLILVAPILGIAVLAVKATSRGPAFYRQARVGLNGRRFQIYKIRTMRQDAEQDGQPKWAVLNDQRVTAVGRVLRRSHIDELPQLINILRGEMSFVGPRPERTEFVRRLIDEIPCYRLRHLVKPGLTGWAQINFPYGATLEDARRKLEFDLYYVQNSDIVFDLFIIARTLRVAILGQGAR